jgi:hypothetical protein
MPADAPTYRLWALDAVSGLPVGEFANVSAISFSEVLNGYGTASFTVPLDDPIVKIFPQTVSESSWVFTFKGPGLIGKTDLLIVRDEIAGAAIPGTIEAVFNGPIVNAELSLDSRTATFTANSVYWLFTKRLCDFNRNYKGWDPFNIVRDAWYYATFGKTSTSYGGTGFYNFLMDWTTHSKDILGVTHTKTYGFAATDGRSLDQVCKDLSSDPTTGFDFRVDISLYNRDPKFMTPNMGQNRVYRALKFGYPQFFRTQPGVLSPANGLVDLTQSFDLDTTATQVWTYGASVGTTRKHGRKINKPMLAAGYHLLEEAIDKSDVNDQNLLNSMADMSLKLLQPPGWVATVVYRPSAMIPYSYYHPGDIININCAEGMMPDGDIQYKVISKATSVVEDGTEKITLTLNNPLTDTSA